MRFACLSAAAWFLIVAVAIAQAPGGGGRPGPGGGAGGRGGFGPASFGPLGILQIEQVRTELEISESQQRQIDDLRERINKELQKGVDFQAFQGLNEEQRQQKMAELRDRGQQIQVDTLTKMGQILSRKQYERFKELRMQRDGIRAIVQPDIAQDLGLSEEQLARANQLLAESMQAGFGGGRPGAGGGAPPKNFQEMTDEERKKFGEQMRKGFEEMRKRGEELQKKLQGVLTGEQKKLWEQLQGEKFEFPAFGGPGGGFGFGGPGNGPPRNGAQPPAEKGAPTEGNATEEGGTAEAPPRKETKKSGSKKKKKKPQPSQE